MNIKRQQLLLYAVTDRSWLAPGETLEAVVEQLLQNGVTLVQLREKGPAMRRSWRAPAGCCRSAIGTECLSSSTTTWP